MDAVLLSAVDLAREAAIEAADDAQAVGEHLGATEVDTRLLTHTFACTLPGYRGWVWAVTVARAPRGREATLAEAHLVPADDALLAPPWVPWAERIRPGDLEAAMALPMIQEDPRLVPGFEITDEVDEDTLEIWELGLGRERVLGPEGRNSAAERWHRGSHGPMAAAAIASPEPCSTCAFFVPLSGSMGLAFGACANEWSPSDGQVVTVDHGCGAHSQTDVEKQSSRWPATEPVIDTEATDPLVLEAQDDEPEQEDALAAENTADAGDSDAPAAPPVDGPEGVLAAEIPEAAPSAVADDAAPVEDVAPEPQTVEEPQANMVPEGATPEVAVEPEAHN